MGPYRTATLIWLAALAAPAMAQEAGWQYSPLPGEGDRASMGCARGSTADDFACLVVRCEDDFSHRVHVHASRAGDAAGRWDVTLDREARSLLAVPAEPYGARFEDPDGWLLDGLRHGTFVYLRHSADKEAEFAFISLAGSFVAIEEAFYWCAPRVPTDERSVGPDVNPSMSIEPGEQQ